MLEADSSFIMINDFLITSKETTVDASMFPSIFKHHIPSHAVDFANAHVSTWIF